MNLITLHRCKTCAKVWFPDKLTNADICPTCDLTLAEADELWLNILESLLQGESVPPR
jgi:predicted Zn-ribbon and HTH transcriptional regulator